MKVSIILHGKKSDLMTFVCQQLSQIEGVRTVSTATIVASVD